MKGDRTMAKVERGEGRKVQVEIPIEMHQRLALEKLRRERQGSRATLEDLVFEAVASFAETCPSASPR